MIWSRCCKECGEVISDEMHAINPETDLCNACCGGTLQDLTMRLRYANVKGHESANDICKIIFGGISVTLKEYRAMVNTATPHWTYEEWAASVLDDGDEDNLPSQEGYEKDSDGYKQDEEIARTAMKRILKESPYYSNEVKSICNTLELDYDKFCLAIMRSTLLPEYYE